MSKVNEKRNKKIQEAASEQNWEKVSDLLNQPIENSLRKDRKYGIFSLNTVINTDGQCTEFGDSISESAGDPLDILLEKEKGEQLSVALSILPNNMKQIIIGYYFENKSFAQCLWQDKPTYNCSAKVHNSASSLGQKKKPLRAS